MKYIITATISALLGVTLTVLLMLGLNSDPADQFAAAMAYNTNPAHFAEHPSGLRSIEPRDVYVPLARMVERGDILVATYVITGLTKSPDTTQHWLQAVNVNADILWAKGLGTHNDTEGFTAWYHPSAQSAVDGIVHQLRLRVDDQIAPQSAIAPE